MFVLCTLVCLCVCAIRDFGKRVELANGFLVGLVKGIVSVLICNI